MHQKCTWQPFWPTVQWCAVNVLSHSIYIYECIHYAVLIVLVVSIEKIEVEIHYINKSWIWCQIVTENAIIRLQQCCMLCRRIFISVIRTNNWYFAKFSGFSRKDLLTNNNNKNNNNTTATTPITTITLRIVYKCYNVCIAPTSRLQIIKLFLFTVPSHAIQSSHNVSLSASCRTGDISG